ncbi:MAG: hypothetical protein AB7I18_14450 [Candidatus Berkiella sp.]
MPTLYNEHQANIAEIQKKIERYEEDALIIDELILMLLEKINKYKKEQLMIENSLLEFTTTLPYGVFTDSNQMTDEQAITHGILLGNFELLTSQIENQEDIIDALKEAATANIFTRKKFLDAINGLLQLSIEELQTELNTANIERRAKAAQEHQDNDRLFDHEPALLVRHKISQREMNSIALPPECYPANPRRAAR